MTAAQFEYNNMQTENVDVNPLLMFTLLFIMPYVLFFGLLMFLTDQTDIVLLFASVRQDDSMVYMKAWVIGSFVLSSAGALFFSGYRTKTYISKQFFRPRETRAGSVSTPPAVHFIIEETLPDDDEVAVSDTSEQRYARLEGVLGDKGE